jgi:acetyl esterase/lipase
MRSSSPDHGIVVSWQPCEFSGVEGKLNVSAKRYFMTIACILFSSAMSLAADKPHTLNVWPGKAPGGNRQVSTEKWEGMKATNITVPTLKIFRPEKGKDTGVAVIVCPGGGYQVLMMSYEGEDVAQWLNTIGITGIVLKYRVPAPPGVARYMPGLQDAQRSLSLVRSRAREWGISPDHIGILGFSAGGHLAAAACTNFDKRAYEPIDTVDQVSCRPDFGVSIYPGGIVKKGTEGVSPEIRPDKQTSPMFIVQANDDPVNSENSVALYLALKHAGVPAELHIYARGGHGFGLRPSDKPCSTWPQRCAEWMRSEGLLPGDNSH